MDKQQEIDLEKRVRAATETLIANALINTDSLVCVLDAMATLHAILLVKRYEENDWATLIRVYADHVADKIIQIGEAQIKIIESGNDRTH
jgi:hypothetical protein